jgi:hypothetical protein
MVLRRKTRESRSPPGPRNRDQITGTRSQDENFGAPASSISWFLNPGSCPLNAKTLATPEPSAITQLYLGPGSWLPSADPGTAGWSSPVARQAHNLKVAGSNPAPATKEINVLSYNIAIY